LSAPDRDDTQRHALPIPITARTISLMEEEEAQSKNGQGKKTTKIIQKNQFGRRLKMAETKRERRRDFFSLRSQTPKHIIRGGWSHDTDTSEPVVGYV
jgi:hypothetical protein